MTNEHQDGSVAFDDNGNIVAKRVGSQWVALRDLKKGEELHIICKPTHDVIICKPHQYQDAQAILDSELGK